MTLFPQNSVEDAIKHHKKHGDMDGRGRCLLSACALHYPDQNEIIVKKALRAFIMNNKARLKVVNINISTQIRDIEKLREDQDEIHEEINSIIRQVNEREMTLEASRKEKRTIERQLVQAKRRFDAAVVKVGK